MLTTSSLPRRAALATAAAATAITLTSCGANEPTDTNTSPRVTTSPTVPAGEHNAADVTFAQEMIPHHRQAVVMANMAETRASSSQLKSLAEQIEEEQQAEIHTMAGWLRAWNEEVPRGMDGTDHGNRPMPGRMSDEQLDEMRGQSGPAFDSMFLTMMIEHHETAIEMAKTEQQQGAYGPAKRLAADIITSQTAEISQMRKMLDAS